MQTPESIPQGPRARLLLGSCRFKGIFDCPCHEGSAFESIKDLGLNTPCEKCGHPLVLHNEHPGSIAPIVPGLQPRIKTELHMNDHEGPSTPGNRSADNRFAMADDLPDLQEELCQRSDTVLKIAKLLVEGESVLIWGMKDTGKTTLANLLFDFLESREVKVILISSWPTASSKMKVEEVLLEYARAQFPDLTNKELPTTDLMFIISEAEEALKTARSRSAWNTLIKASESSETRPRFCIFSHQGILPDPNSVFASMPEVSHLKTHGNGDGQLSLFFTLAEFEEYFQQNHARYGYELHRDAADHIYWLTAGHPTILRLVLRYIKLHINHTAAGVPHITTPVILRSDIITMMHNKDGLFIYLGDNVYPGSYARENKSVINIFKKLLQSPEGKIGWDSTTTKTVIEKCFLNGLIVHEIDATNPDEDVFRFPSPLHARWAGWYHKIETDVDVYAGELTP